MIPLVVNQGRVPDQELSTLSQEPAGKYHLIGLPVRKDFRFLHGDLHNANCTLHHSISSPLAAEKATPE